MADSDGRSTFGALYIGIAIVSMLIFFSMLENPTGSDPYIAPWCLLFAGFFGIVGMYKLATNPQVKYFGVEDNIEGEKDRNSNLEVRIFNDKKMLAIIILIALFIITRF